MGDNSYKMLPLILLSQIALSIAAPANQCDLSKIAIDGGEYNLTDGANVGSKVVYTCPKGQYPHPFPSRECLFNGQWSNAESQCIQWTQHPIRGRTGGFMNIFIVLDTSGSLGEDNFIIAKEASEVFIEKMSSFDFFPRYSIISYATETKPIIELSDDDSIEAYKVIDKLKEFKYSAHRDKTGTNTRRAMAKVYAMLSLQNVRDPENFLKTKNVILLITDGKYNIGGDPTVEVKKIREILDINEDSEREDYLDIYVFGLGEEISHDEINDIASKKSSQHHVFRLETVEDMKKAFDEMIDSEGTLHMCGFANEPSEYEKVDVKYPWIAKITITRPGSQETCKGSIISKDFILTAAHCFNLDEELHTISVEVGGRGYKVKNLHRHDKYNPAGKQDQKVEKSFDYDLALIELKTKIEFSSNSRPICLPCTSGTSWALRKLGKSVTCSDHEKEILSSEVVKAMFVAEEVRNKLERKNVLIKRGSKRQACLDDTKKIDKFKDIPDIRDVVTDNFLCTGGMEPQVDPQTCNGDSGGPVIVQYKQRYIQVGVISWRTINSCKGPKRNKGPVPALSRDFHTDLFHMMDWIKEKAYELDFL
ncbi:complement factor B-like isoform X1 [Bufo bufo]|uniref:complement factor B-like isoform X1 n=1 Tax=Bufo bufo TaxID=8384 RepID=UPI001ABE5EA5|nr:complement factor B-like isoform X1 [Bufo bufo]